MNKFYLVALLSISAAFGFNSLPAYADKIVNTQIINQDVNITGNGNTVTQSAGQVSMQNQRNLPNANSNKKSGNVNQNSYQGIDQSANVRGNGNTVNQGAQQVNVQNNVEGGKKHRHGNRHGNPSATNQTNYQEVGQNAIVRGNGNEVYQNAEQVNVQNRSSDRKRKDD